MRLLWDTFRCESCARKNHSPTCLECRQPLFKELLNEPLVMTEEQASWRLVRDKVDTLLYYCNLDKISLSTGSKK